MHCSGLPREHDILELALVAEELRLPPELHAEAFCIALKWVGLLRTVSLTESLCDVLRLRVVDLPGTESSPCTERKHNNQFFSRVIIPLGHWLLSLRRQSMRLN